MGKIKHLFQTKKKYLVAGVLAIGLALYFILGDKTLTDDTIIIKRSLFLNQVSVSGKVEAASEAQLGFATSGRIGKIFVKNNQEVMQGSMLAQLEIEDLLADLKIKEANSRTSDVSLESAREELEKTKTEENTKVESAYRALLSSGLTLTPQSNDYDVDPPTVSGIYDGQEGQYKISIEKDNITLPDLSLSTFGLEKTKKIIDKNKPTALGTRGLFISFDGDIDSYDKTIWYLDIPNKSSSAYLSNLNAYNEAKKRRDSAIKESESKYNKLLAEQEGDAFSAVAQAEIQKIKAEIRKNTIYAPFSGRITNIEKEVGEISSSNEPLISMISTGTFEVESFVPEVNIALIKLYDEGQLTLDAYGEDVLFKAKVISIDQAETIRDGVSTYKIKLQFNEEDSRIRSGMTANVSIIVFSKPDVIVIPGGVVFEKDGKKFVQIKNDKRIIDREVVLGDVSSLGQVEVLSGLEEGDEVVLIPSTSLAE